MTRLLLAPAGHGKTERVIQRARQVLAEEPLAPIFVIVPNSIQANNFRKRLSASPFGYSAGGALGVEVHTFHTLYAELLTRVGQPLPLLLDPVRIRLLRFIVDGLCERGRLPSPVVGRGAGGEGNCHYAALRDKKTGRPILAVEYEFEDKGEHTIACSVQDDQGGERAFVQTIEVK